MSSCFVKYLPNESSILLVLVLPSYRNQSIYKPVKRTENFPKNVNVCSQGVRNVRLLEHFVYVLNGWPLMQSVVESHVKAYLESGQISKKLFAKIFND